MCTALAVLNKKLIINSNEIYENSNFKKNKKIKFIAEVF